MGLRELLSRLGRRLREAGSKPEAQNQPSEPKAPVKPGVEKSRSSSKRRIIEALGTTGSRLLDLVGLEGVEPAPVGRGGKGSEAFSVDLFSPGLLDPFGSGGRKPRRRRGGSRRRRGRGRRRG